MVRHILEARDRFLKDKQSGKELRFEYVKETKKTKATKEKKKKTKTKEKKTKER